MHLEPNQRPDPKTQTETKDHRKIKSARGLIVPTIDLAKTNAELRRNAAALPVRRIPAPKTKVRIVALRGIVHKSGRDSKEIRPRGAIQMFAKVKGHLAGIIQNFVRAEKVIAEARVLSSETVDQMCVPNSVATVISVDRKCKVRVPMIEAIKAAPACRDRALILRTTTQDPEWIKDLMLPDNAAGRTSAFVPKISARTLA